MSGPARRAALTVAALAAAVVVWLAVTLPPAARPQPGALPPTYVSGAYHVHTSGSDGSGSVDAVAAAAAAAGLDFIILTDHGDGTRPPLPPALRSGVLVIDAAEISTRDGHIVALGLRGAAPYPLAGAARDVVEDIHRQGGLAIVAHPDSPKTELRWRGAGATYDGFEWLNVDSEWRDDTPPRLAATLLRAVVRPAEAVASLFGGRERSFAPWTGGRRVRFTIAAHDAHGSGRRDEDDQSTGWPRALSPVPGYESLFRTAAQIVDLRSAPTGDAAADAASILASIGAGHSYSVVRAFADPAVLTFHAAQSGGAVIAMGESLAPGPASIRAELSNAPDARLTILDRGRRLADGFGGVTWQGEPAGDSIIWVEAYAAGHAFPWVVSNAIFGYQLRQRPPVAAAPSGEARSGRALPANDEWLLEHDPTSRGERTVVGGRLHWTLALGRERTASPYVALVRAITDSEGYGEISFQASSDRPMRLSVQVRLPGAGDGQRWGRSVYLDETARRVVLRLEDFEPIGQTTTLRPVVAEVRSLLFVVDTVNALPGATGAITIAEVSLGSGPSGPGR